MTSTDDGAVLLDERRGRYFQLNGSGYVTLRVLLEGEDQDAAVRRLVEEYDVSTERATHDVRALLEQLASAGLVQT
jgi:hypothetical protein